jgi:hypothetical protein
MTKQEYNIKADAKISLQILNSTYKVPARNKPTWETAATLTTSPCV